MFRKGNIPWNKGKGNKIVCKYCKKEYFASLKQKSKYCSIKCYYKHSIGKKGYWAGKKHNDAYKKKFSLLFSGKNNPRYGVKLEKELREKISKSVLAHYRKNGTDYLKGPRPKTSLALMGRKPTLETRRKMSEKRRLRVTKNETREKMSIAFRGNKCHLWRGGKTKLKELIRSGLKYRIWRNEVFKRDNYTCNLCGHRGGNLESHHKIALSKLIDNYNIKTFEEALNCKYLWEIDNGITLCIPCHVWIDKFRRQSYVGTL